MKMLVFIDFDWIDTFENVQIKMQLYESCIVFFGKNSQLKNI